jgi:MFS family permease
MHVHGTVGILFPAHVACAKHHTRVLHKKISDTRRFPHRLLAGFGAGACSMIAPLYVSENAPRALRGALTGTFQFFNTFGVMLSFWIDYGAELHLSGSASYMVPLALQGVPAVLLIVGMLFMTESPRFLAKQDRWEKARQVLALVRNLPEDHPYVQSEFSDIALQLERERLLINGAGWRSLQREMWTIPGNRKRVLISFILMLFQNTTGSNAINYYGMFRQVRIFVQCTEIAMPC